MYIASITPYLLHIVKYLYFSFFCYKYMIETHKQNDSNKRKWSFFFFPSFLLSYIPSFLLSFLPFLPFLPSFLLSFIPFFIPFFIPSFLPSFFPSFFFFFACLWLSKNSETYITATNFPYPQRRLWLLPSVYGHYINYILALFNELKTENL